VSARWRLAAVLCALAAALAAGTAHAGVRPAYGGTIRIALPVLPRERDPALASEPADLLLARATAGQLLEVTEDGRLAPGLLEEVPVPEAGGLAFRLRVRAGSRTASGAPLGAADVAHALERLLSRARPSPHAWVALPILGADALLAGRTATLAGAQVLSPRELLLRLAFPLPELPWLLASPALAIPGAGAFVPAASGAPSRSVELAPNPGAAAGLPFAGRLVLVAADARGAARLLEKGALELVVRPEAAGGVVTALPALTVTLVAVNAQRLGDAAPAVRAALAAIDRAALARRFARGPAVALATIVPPALLGDPPPAPPGRPAPAGASAARAPAAARPLRLLVPDDSPDARAAAERIQVTLFDRGLRARLEPVPRAALASQLAARDHDVAVLSVTVLAHRPALAAGQVALAVAGPDAARRAMALLAGKEGASAQDAAAALSASLDVVPLFATGLRVSAAPALQGLAPGADGAFDPGGLWLLGGGAPP